MKESVKVVSFNIEFCAEVTKGYWQYAAVLWKYFLPHNTRAIWHISDIINSEEIDIATFTEMDAGGYRTRDLNYMDIVSQLTPLKNNVFYPVSRFWFNLGNRGNGIATKYDILEVKNIKLKTSMENRYLSISKVKLGGHIVNVLTTQLALGHGARIKEFTQIAEVINNIKGPIIFTGDLNTQRENELQILNTTRLKRIETKDTFPSWNPRRRIDYIFHSPEFEVVDCKVLSELKVSDHLPIIAELKLKKQ